MWFSSFLLNELVSRVNRRMPIRIGRFARSTSDVDTSAGLFLKYLGVIAWESEVWVADAPSHLIHFNGARFLGPYDRA